MGISKEDQAVVDEFVEAAKNGDLTTVRRLLPELNGKTEGGDTALHAAAQRGHVDVVEEILKQGRALESDARDADDATPLMLAAGQGHFEVVHKLCRSGANPNHVDRMGWTPLHYAAAGGHSLVVSFLIGKCKKDVLFDRDTSGCSPLWLAASSGDPETVRLLLLQGADPDEVNGESVSVFEAAREVEVEDDEGEAKIDAIVEMLSVASDRWTEERRKQGQPEPDHEALEDRPATVLDGTMDGPSIPVGDEGQPFLNQDAKEKLLDEVDLEAVRVKVIEALKLEDAFVETYLKGNMETVEL